MTDWLFDLPNETLSYAASFLARPSRVLFAIVICNWFDDELLIQDILGNCEVLDFGEIEGSLASKITDNLLEDMLLRIDADAVLKKLKLAGCVNITGSGLYPLHGSAVVEQIDLGLVAEHKSPVLDAEHLISYEHALPILDSIIEREDGAIRNLTSPKSWRDERNPELNEFLTRCNQAFSRRNITCSQCVTAVEESDPWFILSRRGEFCGLQNFTCYSCTKHFCYNCTDEDDECILRYCNFCEKEYCFDCGSMEKCVDCNEFYCKECLEECGECGNTYCGECIGKCGGFGCSRKFCSRCANQKRACDYCGIHFCNPCWDFHGCEYCGKGSCMKCSVSEATFCSFCIRDSDEYERRKKRSTE